MKNDFNKTQPINRLVPGKIRTFFIDHLNHIYCAKSHFVERLAEIATQDLFADLKNPIERLTAEVNDQLSRLNVIFGLLNADPSVKQSNGLIGVAENAFNAIDMHKNEPALRDSSIYYYLCNITHMEFASYKVLQFAAVQLKNRPVSLLIKKNFKDAKSDRGKILFG